MDQTNQSKLAAFVLGLLIGAGVMFVGMSYAPFLAVHVNGHLDAAKLGSQDLMALGIKCEHHQGSAETCQQVNSVIKAKLLQCSERTSNSPALREAKGGNFSPADFLEYCAEKFPDLR